MATTTKSKTAAKTTKATAKAPVKGAAAAKKEAPAKEPKAKATPAPKADKAPTKADKARAIFTKMTGQGKERKDIVAAFESEVGLSHAAAATYYQNIKTAAAKAAE